MPDILAVYITIHLRSLAHYRRSPCLPGMSLAPAQRSHPATSVAGTVSSTMGPIPWRIVRRSLRSFVHWYNVAVLHAGVAELVDAPDSKSGGAKAPCRFEPDLRYSRKLCKSSKNAAQIAEVPVFVPGFLAATRQRMVSSRVRATLTCMLGSIYE